MQTGTGRLPFIAAVAVIIGLSVLIAYFLLSPPDAPEGEVAERLTERRGANAPNAPTIAPEQVEKAPGKRVHVPATKMRKLPNAEARAALSRAIAEARRHREEQETDRHGGGGSGSPGGDSASDEDEEPRGKLSKEYIRETIHEAIPMIKECYDLALEENPKLSGRLDVHFTISGEPDVGGLVDESDVVAEEGLAFNETLEDCVRETVYTLEFPPPEGGGVVKVRYPLRFRPAEEEEESE